jgi:DNA-binding FadR family transcriptional regulator
MDTRATTPDGTPRHDALVAGAIASGVAAEPIGRQRLSERVTAQLEQLILSGKLRTGETLPSERQLMQLFGVGRTSIREALFALQRRGVVTAQPGLRPVVSSPRAEAIVAELSGTVRLFVATEPGLREFQAARRFFEPAVARFAARNATPQDVARLAAALQDCEDALPQPQRFVAADVAFHFAIVQATHNTLLIALHRAVLDWLRDQRTVSIEPGGSAKAAHLAHRRVYAAIAAQDADAAESAMLEHLEEVERYYWQASRRHARKPPVPRETRDRQ